MDMATSDLKWFAHTNLHQYKGEYVVIADKKVFAHGLNLKEMIATFRKKYPSNDEQVYSDQAAAVTGKIVVTNCTGIVVPIVDIPKPPDYSPSADCITTSSVPSIKLRLYFIAAMLPWRKDV